LKAFGDDALSLADLAAQKNHLEAEIAQYQKWLQENREELLRKDAERQEQEFLTTRACKASDGVDPD